MGLGARLLTRPLARLPRTGAVLALVVIALALGWSAWAVPRLAVSEAPADSIAATSAAASAGEGDFALYARIVQRMDAGESYYEAALAEQRAGNYPTRPFVTVRLPTLAWLNHRLGGAAVAIAMQVLLAGVALAFAWRLGPATGAAERAGAVLAVLLAGAGVLAEQAPLVHELAAGLLLSLALALHRSGRWWPSLLLAALALAIRELALPFVLLWLAFALAGRRWREAAALGGLVAGFALALYLHYLGVAAHLLPGDRTSPGWASLAGPALPLLAIARLTALLVLPLWLAAPLALLALVGWCALGPRLGLFASLYFAGFLGGMALFARLENFYWALLVLPAYAAGLAFAPRALADLWRSAKGVRG